MAAVSAQPPQPATGLPKNRMVQIADGGPSPRIGARKHTLPLFRFRLVRHLGR
jgi:hypothetical protein